VVRTDLVKIAVGAGSGKIAMCADAGTRPLI
jgi:hypothetical protein